MIGLSTDMLHESKREAGTRHTAAQGGPLPYKRAHTQVLADDEAKQGDAREAELQPAVPCCTSAATSTTSTTSASEGGLTTTTRAHGVHAENAATALHDVNKTHNVLLTGDAHINTPSIVTPVAPASVPCSSGEEDDRASSEEGMRGGRGSGGNEGAGVQDVSRLSDAPAALPATLLAAPTAAHNGAPSALTRGAPGTTGREETSLPSCTTSEPGSKTGREQRWSSFVKPPRQQGAVVQLYSLTQLDALIESGAHYMSQAEGSMHQVGRGDGGGRTGRHEVLCLQPGESVLLLLHHGERGLSDVTNRFTGELSQVRIFALNLDALPPQDYSMAEQQALCDDAATPRAKRQKTETGTPHVGDDEADSAKAQSPSRSQCETNNGTTARNVEDEDEEEEMLLITPHKAAMASAATTQTAVRDGLMSSVTPTAVPCPLDTFAVLDCSTLAKQLCSAAESVIRYLNRRLRLQLPLSGHPSAEVVEESGREGEVWGRNRSCSPSPAPSPAPPTPSHVSSSASLSRATPHGPREPLRPTTLVLWRAGGAACADYPRSPPDMHGLAALSQAGLPTCENDDEESGSEGNETRGDGTTGQASGRAFRLSLRRRGRPLAAKEIRTVEQLHSLSLWTPVYTVAHLRRTARQKVTQHPHHAALRAAGQPSYTLLYLGASWCPPCMRFVATMPQLICEKMPENVVCTLKADMDFAKPIYTALKVEIIPTFVILDNAVLCAETTASSSADATGIVARDGASSGAELTRLLLRAEVARVQNSQLTVVATFLEKNCKPLSFDEDF